MVTLYSPLPMQEGSGSSPVLLKTEFTVISIFNVKAIKLPTDKAIN